VDEWTPHDATLILEVLAESTSTYSRWASRLFKFAHYSRTKMAKKRKKKISLSREFYERHEWIQRNIARRLEEHRKLREQSPRPES